MTDNDITFGPFRLDLGERKLSRNGTPVRVNSRALEILCVLAAARGEIVTKDELMARVWPGLVVEENALHVHVSGLRKVIDEGQSGQSFIATAQGRGYRLVGVTCSVPEGRSVTEDQQSLRVAGTSVAVMAFQNMSGDPEQEYFADGIVEDIITGLARIRWLLVIARNSSFIYKGKAVDLKQVGRELGVGYVLEGSVRKAGNRVRITVQLIETQTGTHIWAERYDRLLDDIFAVQDEIAISVIGAIEPSLRRAEIERVKRKRPESLDAYDLVLRALPFVYKFMPHGADPAIPILRKALELDPGYADAHAALAWCFQFRFNRGGRHEEDRAASIYHARAAVTTGGDNATALAIAGIVVLFDNRDIAAAFDLFDRALALSNSNVFALCLSATALAWRGMPELAIERARHALRISPFDTLNYLSYIALSIASFQTGRFDEARDAARRAVESNPDFSVPHALLAAALARLGQAEEARAEALQVLALEPPFSIDRYSAMVELTPTVFRPFADVWREIGLPDD
jgi:TolB-like protein/Tfp pilus assembly protein PilF